MVRTQIQLTDGQAKALRALAAAEGRSMADIIREGIDALLAERGLRDREEVKRRALAVVGAFHSGLGDLASDHDRHLAEVYEQ